MEYIRLNVPLLGKEELDEIDGVLKSGFLTQGPKVAEFEEIIRKYVGTKYAFATSSATTALHLAAVALDIKPGDEVLVADFTFPATANIVVQQGAIPIPVDIDIDTFTMNVIDMESKITSKTKAIIPVDAFGLCCDIKNIEKIANKHGLPIIQDSACSLGSTYDGQMVGQMATATCFSFHPRKSITTGEGGMLVTDDEKIAEIVTKLRTHGGVRKEFYLSFEEAGFNYRMSDVLAAIGVAQSRRLEYLLSERIKLATELTTKMAVIEEVICPSTPINRTHTYQSYVVMLPQDIKRDNIIRRLREKNVESTLGTYALHAQPFFQKTYGNIDGDCKESFKAYEQSLTLPLWAGMSSEHLDHIVKSLSETLVDERNA
jgi:perosamine synthetase